MQHKRNQSKCINNKCKYVEERAYFELRAQRFDQQKSPVTDQQNLNQSERLKKNQ